MNKEDQDLLMLAALRYVLPRSTYMVSMVCEAVARNKDSIKDNTKVVMLKDIDEELSSRAKGLSMSHECDEKVIKELRDVLNPIYDKHGEDDGCN